MSERARQDEPRPVPDSEPRREIKFEHSRQFVPILRHLNASLLVSTYAAGKLAVVTAQERGLGLRFHNFEQAMGVAPAGPALVVGSKGQLWFLQSDPSMAPRVDPEQQHDACFLTRRSFFTGNIHVHELAWSDQTLWVVNTLFSCLCSLHDEFSFVPRWRPPFISKLAAEDRCHLNGLAMDAGEPKYVTAMAESDAAAGWRPTKATSGIVIDVPSGETVAGGFAMPHSPRMHQGRLWLLNSGAGSLVTVDPQSGTHETVVEMPGYTRGLAFCGQFAFVGLSRIRETAVFGGVPIAEKRAELRCGVVVVDLLSGQNVAYLQFLKGVEEIFDVQVLPGIRSPVLSGPYPDRDDAQPIWVVPNEQDLARLAEP